MRWSVPARAAAVILASLCAGCTRSDGTYFESSTLTVGYDEAVAPLAEGLMNAYEGVHETLITSTQNASRDALEAGLREHQYDVLLLMLSIDDSNLPQVTIGFETLAVVVHPELSITGLSRDRLRSVFSGQLTTLSELSVNESIQVIVGLRGTSPRLAFETLVMDGIPFTSSARLSSSQTESLRLVSENPYSMAFLPAMYVEGRVRRIEVLGEAANGQTDAPLYQLSVPVVLVAAGNPEGPAHDFLDWVLSEEGQRVTARYINPVASH